MVIVGPAVVGIPCIVCVPRGTAKVVGAQWRSFSFVDVMDVSEFALAV